ncbi:transmembrane protein 275-like [Antennarius striatus]|uniref:transmembrane protein 275-like n=1 Tax=Antennarius striatus TaxID=241820 RepID=UPI0035B1D52F
MVLLEKPSKPSVSRLGALPDRSLPSPALCCACGVCVMLAGVNITLVGVFTFGSYVPTSNLPIIIGPVLLFIAMVFFTACCLVSRRPSVHRLRKAKGGEKWGLMRMGTVLFDMEMSEHTPQDTTAVQLSPTDSPTSSHKSSSSHGATGCQDGAGELHRSEMSAVGTAQITQP